MLGSGVSKVLTSPEAGGALVRAIMAHKLVEHLEWLASKYSPVMIQEMANRNAKLSQFLPKEKYETFAHELDGYDDTTMQMYWRSYFQYIAGLSNDYVLDRVKQVSGDHYAVFVQNMSWTIVFLGDIRQMLKELSSIAKA